METVHYATMDSPVGQLGIVTGAGGSLLRIEFLRKYDSLPHWIDSLAAIGFEPSHDEEAPSEVCRQLGEYFSGERRRFDLALDLRGPEFERKVWNQLLEIPYGQTRSYGDIAVIVSELEAARAVGRANGDNPIPIVVPCHRVIGGDGSLVGFGGGLDVKEWLLVHEGALLCPLPRRRQ